MQATFPELNSNKIIIIKIKHVLFFALEKYARPGTEIASSYLRSKLLVLVVHAANLGMAILQHLSPPASIIDDQLSFSIHEQNA